MPAPEITIETDYASLRIKFGALLHLRVQWPLFAIHAWKFSDRKFVIEYVSANGATVTTDYDDVEKFKKILTLLDGVEFV